MNKINIVECFAIFFLGIFLNSNFFKLLAEQKQGEGKGLGEGKTLFSFLNFSCFAVVSALPELVIGRIVINEAFYG